MLPVNSKGHTTDAAGWPSAEAQQCHCTEPLLHFLQLRPLPDQPRRRWRCRHRCRPQHRAPGIVFTLLNDFYTGLSNNCMIPRDLLETCLWACSNQSKLVHLQMVDIYCMLHTTCATSTHNECRWSTLLPRELPFCQSASTSTPLSFLSTPRVQPSG